MVTVEDLEDIDVWKSYLKKCFKYLNGKINPYFKARKLILEDREIIGPISENDLKYDTYAVMNIDVVKVNIPALYNTFSDIFVKSSDLTLVWRGYCITVIAHELSHADQYIPWYFSSSAMIAEVKNAYEYANEMNMRKFIEQFEDDIRHELGEFNTTIPYANNAYSKIFEKNGNNGIVIPYTKFYSNIQHMWNVLNMFTLVDLYKFVSDYDIRKVAIGFNDRFKDLSKRRDTVSVMYFYPLELDDPETFHSINTSVDVLQYLSVNLYGKYGECRYWEITITVDEDDKHLMKILFIANSFSDRDTMMNINVYAPKEYKIVTAHDAVKEYLDKIGYNK